MKNIIFYAVILWNINSQAETIRDVLERSQTERLQSFLKVSAPNDQTMILQKYVEELTLGQSQLNQPPIDLRLVEKGDVIAEAMLGTLLVANTGIKQFKREEILFILAHEIGHLRLKHFQALVELYQKYIPGEVTPETAKATHGSFGREASGLAWSHEFAADIFAVETLVRAGFTLDQAQEAAFSAIMLNPSKDTATHPASNKRMLNIRTHFNDLPPKTPSGINI